MRKTLTTLMIAVSLTGCAVPATSIQIPTSPAVVAEQTVLDEQAALGVELAYQAAALAALTAIKFQILDQETKTKIAALDLKAFKAVGKVRVAYDAGNASSYAQALPLARAAVADLVKIVGGK